MTMKASRRESLILDHLPQVELLARRLHRRCPQVELDDLIQAGTIGLIQAVDRYDESRGCLLKTIAEHRIRGALLDYLRQIDPLPRNIRRFQKQRDAVIVELNRAGMSPSLEDVATRLGVPVKKYVRLSIAVLASDTLSIEELSCVQRLAG
ncbi:MAG: sigma-70 family RNA polymerase sigma factor [Acidobacteria bacterium]|nr:sigma-70 family RNA polymerase sigma factor [Acidobacteriota bacterium]